MKRATLMLALFSAACGGDDGPAGFRSGGSMGEQCGGPSIAMTQVPSGNPANYVNAMVDISGDKLRVVLLPVGQLDPRSCMLNWTGTGSEKSWILTLDTQELGMFPVGAGTRVWSDAEDATAGTVSIVGYNAEDDTVCGAVSATTPTGMLTGQFSASIYCE